MGIVACSLDSFPNFEGGLSDSETGFTSITAQQNAAETRSLFLPFCLVVLIVTVLGS